MCGRCEKDVLPRIDRREFLKLGGAGLAGAALLGTSGATGVLARSKPSLRAEFEKAAKEYRVPTELLVAMGYVNTLWEMPPPETTDYEEGDLHGRGAYGTMQLVRNPSTDTLGRAASLTGLSVEKLKRERAANVRGGAAVLSKIQGPKKPRELEGWYDAVAEYGGIELYAKEVFDALDRGVSETTSSGERLRLAPQGSVEAPRVYEPDARADYSRAAYAQANSNNYTPSNRETSYNIHSIVVHVVQGSAPSAVNWFKDPRAGVSAHYVVGRGGGIVQCVRNKDIAWHAGNWKYNCHSIGIEHAGYVSNPRSFTRAMYHGSARIAALCCKRHRIPVIRNYIIGHNEVPGATHTDPGRYWRWPAYLKLIKYYYPRV